MHSTDTSWSQLAQQRKRPTRQLEEASRLPVTRLACRCATNQPPRSAWPSNTHGPGRVYSRSVVDQDIEAAHLLDGGPDSARNLVDLEQVGHDAVPLDV
jgi:hypothetical protein